MHSLRILPGTEVADHSQVYGIHLLPPSFSGKLVAVCFSSIFYILPASHQFRIICLYCTLAQMLSRTSSEEGMKCRTIYLPKLGFNFFLTFGVVPFYTVMDQEGTNINCRPSVLLYLSTFSLNKFTHSLIHLFYKYLLNAYYELSIVQTPEI